MSIKREIISMGETIQIDPLDRIPDYDPRSSEHLWVVTTVHRVNPEHWRSNDPTVTPMLDGESLLSVAGPGCFHCEQIYTPLLAKRRYPGEPRDDPDR